MMKQSVRGAETLGDVCRVHLKLLLRGGDVDLSSGSPPSAESAVTPDLLRQWRVRAGQCTCYPRVVVLVLSGCRCQSSSHLCIIQRLVVLSLGVGLVQSVSSHSFLLLCNLSCIVHNAGAASSTYTASNGSADKSPVSVLAPFSWKIFCSCSMASCRQVHMTRKSCLILSGNLPFEYVLAPKSNRILIL